MGGNALELYFTQHSLLLTIFCKVSFVMYGVCALSGVWNRVAIADRHAPNCTSTHFISWSGLSKLTENCLGLIVQGSSWACFSRWRCFKGEACSRCVSFVFLCLEVLSVERLSVELAFVDIQRNS